MKVWDQVDEKTIDINTITNQSVQTILLCSWQREGALAQIRA